MTKTVTWKDNAKKVGDDVFQAGRSMWLAGLGAVSMVDEETRAAFDKLVDRGQKFESSDKNVMGKVVHDATDRAKSLGSKVEDAFQSTVSTALHRAGVPSRDEIRTLIERVEELNQKVEKLHAS